jgi:hypothetical protein
MEKHHGLLLGDKFKPHSIDHFIPSVVVWTQPTNLSATEAEESDARSSRICVKLIVGDGALES